MPPIACTIISYAGNEFIGPVSPKPVILLACISLGYFLENTLKKNQISNTPGLKLSIKTSD